MSIALLPPSQQIVRFWQPGMMHIGGKLRVQHGLPHKLGETSMPANGSKSRTHCLHLTPGLLAEAACEANTHKHRGQHSQGRPAS